MTSYMPIDTKIRNLPLESWPSLSSYAMMESDRILLEHLLFNIFIESESNKVYITENAHLPDTFIDNFLVLISSYYSRTRDVW